MKARNTFLRIGSTVSASATSLALFSRKSEQENKKIKNLKLIEKNFENKKFEKIT